MDESAVYIILGYIFSQIIMAGIDPGFMVAAIVPHGIVEIPVIILTTAAAFRLGAGITKLPKGVTVGQAWIVALGDTMKLSLGLIIPGLVLAAFLEAFITPRIVLLALGG